MNSKIYLCSFANLYLLPALKRFYKQAFDMNVFEDIFLYEELTLGKDFKSRFDDKLNYSVRGFGYWCWKPYIILESLKRIEYNDILFYVDIGCHFKKEYSDRMKNYIEMAEKYDIVVFEGIGLLDKYWTKADLFKYFNVLDNKEITDTNTRFATAIIMKKTDKNIRLVNDWLKVFYTDFSLADDTPSEIKNLDGFIEHRHDQSIFSILSKLYNAKVIDDFDDGKEAIHFSRDKRCIYSDIIYITWLIPFKNLRWKLKNILFNIFSKKFYKRLEKLSNPK